MGIVDVYVLVGLCIVISFWINNKIDDGVFWLIPKEFAMGVFKGNRVGIFEDTSVTIKVIYPKKLNTYGDDTM